MEMGQRRFLLRVQQLKIHKPLSRSVTHTTIDSTAILGNKYTVFLCVIDVAGKMEANSGPCGRGSTSFSLSGQGVSLLFSDYTWRS